MSEETECDLLREIRDVQHERLKLQRESLQLQHAQFDAYKQQLDRAERINTATERIQQRAIRAQRVIFFVVIPLLLILLAVFSWPALRQSFGVHA